MDVVDWDAFFGLFYNVRARSVCLITPHAATYAFVHLRTTCLNAGA
jgi:hypothetical protein